MADFDKALQLEPAADIYFSRGIARAAVNDHKGAIQDYNKVISLDSSVENIFLTVG